MLLHTMSEHVIADAQSPLANIKYILKKVFAVELVCSKPGEWGN